MSEVEVQIIHAYDTEDRADPEKPRKLKAIHYAYEDVSEIIFLAEDDEKVIKDEIGKRIGRGVDRLRCDIEFIRKRLPRVKWE